VLYPIYLLTAQNKIKKIKPRISLGILCWLVVTLIAVTGLVVIVGDLVC
jgi:hypothetical protein